MACGLPIVTTDVGGIPEVLGDAGIVVKPEDVNLLSQAIKIPFLNNKIKEQKSILLKEKIQKYSWKNISKQILDVYKEVL
jgi:glycosyltransferase involved in cell wall biosynthesis